MKKPRTRGSSNSAAAADLLDLAFLELNVLAQDGIVLFDRELLSHRPGIFLGHVEKAGVARAVEPDLGRGRLRHLSHPRIQGRVT